ncbi:MAG: CDP-glycerol glycerophosphotransferase family protein [Clostridioides sp.]|jgi:CDP-glycerol glycerophosphotransferase (TagB/SpsB family)|nr:CDP-glycerol glycerophosphotransferase family protein [Clostridioides sp.]
MGKITCLVNMGLAFLKYPFDKGRFKNRKIWLIGGHSGDIYNDNAKFVYEYMLENHPEVEIYWVANADNPVFSQIPGKKLLRGSVENYLYYYNAEVVIFSHSPSADIAPYNFIVPVLNRFHKKVFKVFLNHGTISFKKRKPMNAMFSKAIDDLLKSYNLVTAGSEFEKGIMVDEWQMSEEVVEVTGIARYDNLVEVKPNIDEEKPRTVLYTPTWRDWIKFDGTKFTETDYFKNIMLLLNDEGLNEVLEENNVYIKIFMHHLMHEFLDDIKENINGSRIIFLDRDTDLASEIKSADVNITDYSSTAIDFLLMDKPILFYQFDLEEYEEKVGSYIDLKSEMFGYLSYNSKEATEVLIDIIKGGFKVSENQVRQKERYIKFNDGKNRERIFNCIENKIEERNNL